MSEPVRSVGDLIRALQQLDPSTLVLVDGHEGGFTRPDLTIIEVQELAGLPAFYGRFMPSWWPACTNQMAGERPPVLLGRPVAAVVLRR